MDDFGQEDRVEGEPLMAWTPLLNVLTAEEQQQIRQMVRRLCEQGEEAPHAVVMAVAVDEFVALTR